MQQVDTIVIGQGIAGLLTTFYLLQSGKSVVVFDTPGTNSASRLSGAVLNPLNLKNGHPAFPKDMLATALSSYRDLERHLQQPLLSQKKLIYVSDTRQQQLPWLAACAEDTLPLIGSCFSDCSRFQETDLWQLDNRRLFAAWGRYQTPGLLRKKETFEIQKCTLHKHSIRYENLAAQKLIFCEGAAGRNNPFFTRLPFTRNRGDVLLLSIPGLPESFIYQLRHRLIPIGNQRFWMGSNYQWNFQDLAPDKSWRSTATTALKEQLKLPFTLIDHLVAERPTTAGQKPLLMRHPAYKQLFYFNGLGTKGFSLAPACCHRLLAQLETSETSRDNS